jgi:hypothetical protein
MHLLAIVSIVAALAALFLLFAAAVDFAYPRSYTTIEAYPTDVRPPRRWPRITTCSTFGVLLAALAAYLMWGIYLPAQRLEEVEAITHKTFKEKLGRQPTKLHLEEDPGTGWGRWEYKGTAWLGETELWDVAVTWTTSGWECKAVRRE